MKRTSLQHRRRAPRSRLAVIVPFALLALGCSRLAIAQEAAEPPDPSVSDMALLSLPKTDWPIVIQTSFQLVSISQIRDEAEELAFTGVLTLVWKDARQQFDPFEEGVDEKVFSGAFQFNEISPGWYPQVTLANAAGQYSSQAVLLRVAPDGTQTLTEKIEAVARVDINMRRLPFDRQRLELVFRLFGFEAGEVVFRAEPNSATAGESVTELPQWTLEGVSAKVRTINATDGTGVASAYAVTVDAKRQPLFMLRLVVMPLAVIVVLSWSVFWMDRSSIGDRLNISFVGILAAVAYQITLVGIVPNVSYFTLMNEFLNVSFLLMCATVVVNLYVAAVDRHDEALGDRIDRVCRWLFPLIYFGGMALSMVVMFLFF